ncbi:metal ABC transporter solute-binding protein, Zn/Mn family [Metabacillus arenae]|uniref:Zinc ABC transporter substrate-binding protein n=1 Tax=Metabacillus arenae TaxID=2771434 RepID=A0A926NLJ2_9BACI|nr:zinc ABC transporter substrate-binding protein [Metabacillus arenae]MBD1380247.1 zinc ABC transporter substrate-binding protein [Metabacillus arenae]
MKKAFLITFLLIIGSVLAGCNSEPSQTDTKQSSDSQSSEKLKIYTTIFPIQDFTKKIGGEHVEVESIYPPNADAHTFDPSTKDMVKLAESDAFIYSGVGLEGFADKASETLKGEDVSIVKAGEGVELSEATHDHAQEGEAHADDHAHEEGEAHEEGDTHADDHTHEEGDAHAYDHAHKEGNAHADDHAHNHGDKDPHIWLDPMLSIEIAENIKEALIELKPEAKEDFEKSFTQLKKELETLDAEYHKVIEESPKKEILVSHAAYGYWEESYGLEQISVLGLSPTQEPSQKQLQKIIETAKEHDIKYVIFESNVSSKISDIVRNEIGAEDLTLSNLESISEDDLKNKEDYFSLMNKNLETLKKALSK